MRFYIVRDVWFLCPFEQTSDQKANGGSEEKSQNTRYDQAKQGKDPDP